MGLAATALLVGCSSDETLDMAAPNAIEFDTFVNASTKATDITTNTITDFSVYGNANSATPLFARDEVTKDNTSPANWICDKIVFWEPSNTYHFHAFAPVENATIWGFTPSTTESEYAKGTLVFNNNGDKDLIHAYQTAQTGAQITTKPGKVQFTFNHLLSRVRFKFTHGLSYPNLVMKVKDVKITNGASRGECTIEGSNATWEVKTSDGGTTYPAANLDFGEVIYDNKSVSNYLSKDESAVTQHLYVIPQKSTQESAVDYKVEFTVEVYQTKESQQTLLKSYPLKSTLNNVSPAMGCSYEFSADITEEVLGLYIIEFDVTEVSDWGDTWTPAGPLSPIEPNGN